VKRTETKASTATATTTTVATATAAAMREFERAREVRRTVERLVSGIVLRSPRLRRHRVSGRMPCRNEHAMLASPL